VTLTSVSFTDETGAVTQLSPEGYSQAALLDSGTSATLLTNDIYSAIAIGFGAVGVDDEGDTAVPCSYANSNASFSYQFGGSDGPTITVPVSQVVGPQEYSASAFSDPSGGCVFGFGSPIDGVSILGDTFLRSAYVVFDIENNAAAIAQAKYNVSSSSIVVIPSGTALPEVSSTATATGTQLTGVAATSDYAPVAASTVASTVLAGTPTFNLGVSPTTGSATAKHSGAATAVAPQQAAMVGVGLVFGALIW